MKSMAVYSGAYLVEEPSRLLFDGLPFSSNPMPLEGNDIKGFTKPIGILVDSVGTFRYTLIMTDSLDQDFTLQMRVTGI